MGQDFSCDFCGVSGIAAGTGCTCAAFLLANRGGTTVPSKVSSFQADLSRIRRQRKRIAAGTPMTAAPAILNTTDKMISTVYSVRRLLYL